MGTGSWSNDQQLILTLPGGAVTGARIVIDGTRDAIFVYDAAGALFASLAATAGTDGLGNAFLAGLTFYNGGHVIGNWSAGGFEIITPNAPTSMISVTPVFSANVSPKLQWTNALSPAGGLPTTIFAQNGAVTAGQDTAFLLGPAAPQATDAHQSETMVKMTAGGASDGAKLTLTFSGSAIEDYLSLDKTGATVTGYLQSAQPNTTPAIAEIWHTLPLGAGFAQLAGFGLPRYQIERINGGRCRLEGTVQLTANHAQGDVIGTVSSAYAPAAGNGPKLFLTANNISGGTGRVESLNVDTGGAIHLGQGGSNGNYVSLDGVSWALD